MGKIFGISDLPVSTIMSPFKQIKLAKQFPMQISKTKNTTDRFISTASQYPIVKNKSSIAKLVSYFNKLKK